MQSSSFDSHRQHSTVILEISWAINFRIVRKFLEFTKINSLLLKLNKVYCETLQRYEN